ncbi:MAG: OprD family porin [Desulfobacteraceae bacterium]|nr:OprD family porin [Desulfobacteraceae bacterium]
MEIRYKSVLIRLGAIIVFMTFFPLNVFAADDLVSAFKQASVSGSLRIYHWEKDFDNTPSEQDAKSTAIGGIFSYETAPLFGISAGFGFRTAQSIFSDDDYGTYFGLLQGGSAPNSNKSFTGLAEGFLRYSNYNTIVTLGRQYIDTPYMNPHDVRLVPKSFEGLSVVNTSLRKLELNAGYFTHYMGWTDDDYVSMTETIAGNKAVDTKGNYYLGLRYKPIKGMDLGLWGYKFTDTYNLIFVRAKYFKVFNSYWKGFIDARATKFDSAGDELAGDIDTYTYGFIGGLMYKDWTLILMAQQNGDDDPVEPFGHSRSCTTQENRAEFAEETGLSAKLGYDFGGLGLRGLSAYVKYSDFDNPDNPADKNWAQDRDELEFCMEYKFDGAFEGLRLRARYAIVDKDEDEQGSVPSYMPAKAGEDSDAVRLYLIYDF